MPPPPPPAVEPPVSPPAPAASQAFPPPPPPTSPSEAPQDASQAPPVPGGGQINLNTVTFEQLRQENLSVTQATRLLAHRERLGRFGSVDELDEVPGFPQDVLDDLKRRSTI
jgi:DNA uptake protein ComE-like DNA-binding protein